MENSENKPNIDTIARETNVLILPFSSITVVYYTYIKAREIRDLSRSKDGQQFLIENLIVSINGIKENIYERVMDLRYEDYRQIDNALTSLVQLTSEKKS
jgi:hypothetical protein